MKNMVIVFLALFIPLCSFAQTYKITTDQKDDFSQAIVQVLNCAANRFNGCTGDSIRSTWLMGDDYKLTIPFPGSTIGIVRKRDWDKNAYIEFRGYKNIGEVNQGMKSLMAKIKKALGDQLVPPVITGDHKTMVQLSMMSVKDANGYFTANIELFPGSSHADPYLLGPEKEEESDRPKKYFILLKVQGGIPSYQYYIKDGVPPPDQKLHRLLQQLVQEAIDDYDSLPVMRSAVNERKKVDTLQAEGYTVYFNSRGHHRSASIVFDAAGDSSSVDSVMRRCRQAIEAVAGSRYVYHLSSYLNTKSIVYYASYHVPGYNNKSPRIDLQYAPEQYGKPGSVVIRIQGLRTHPVKRSASLDD